MPNLPPLHAPLTNTLQVKRQFTLNARDDDTYTIPVGGLANNKELGISRGRYALKVSQPPTPPRPPPCPHR
jgi:hypothetical protein